MKFWFSKKKNNNAECEEKNQKQNNNNNSNNDDIYNAVLKSREAIEALEKKQVQVEKKIKQMEIEAKKKVEEKQMNNAKLLLKRKKLYEQELQNILNNRLTLEDNLINLENMQLHKIAVNALSFSAITHKKMNTEINSQRVEKILDTIHENKEMQEEVNQALNFNLVNAVDDDEIDRELELIKQTNLEEKIKEIEEIPDVPKETVCRVKNTTLSKMDSTSLNEETDEEELKELIGELT